MHTNTPDTLVPSPLVTFREVSFAYRAATGEQQPALALDHVSFSVYPGRATALVGPNGAGKSTALRLLLGLDFPVTGEVRFDGQAITAEVLRDAACAKRLRQRIGLVFQDPVVQLFCPTVADEVAFAPLQMDLSADEVSTRVTDCLELFGLSELADRAPWQLSGGEKRRCAMACVVSAAPELLCLDEPTNDLDEESRTQVVQFLQSFVAAGKTVLVATHDAQLVEELGAEVIEL